MTAWPLVGRDEVLRSADEALASGGVLLLGDAGVGKTRVAAELGDRRAVVGDRVERIAGEEAAAGIPLAAISHLLPNDLISRSLVDGQLDRGALYLLASESMRSLAEGHRLVLVVDDANWLDDLTLTLVCQLVHSGDVALIATVRGSTPPNGPLERLVRGGDIIEMLLTGLDLDDVREILRQTVGPVGEGAAAVRLSEASRGNPLVLRELVHSTIRSGALAQSAGRWRLSGEITPSARVTEIVGSRLRDLDDRERRCAEVLGLGGRLGLGVVTALVDESAVEALDEKGVVEVDVGQRRRTVRFAHPLFGEIVRGGIPEPRARALRLELATALENTGARRRDDPMRIASWRLDGGATVSTEVLVDAARLFVASHRPDDAERAARLAWDVARDPDAGIALMSALYRLGRPEELEQVGAGVMDLDLSESQLATVARQRALNLFFSYGVAHRSSEVIEEALARLPPGVERERLRAHHAQVLVNLGWPRRALDSAADVDRSDDRVHVELAGAVAMASSMVGRPSAALEATEYGLSVIESSDDRSLFDQKSWLTVNRIVALLADARGDEAAALGERARSQAIEDGAIGASLWFSHWCSWVALHQGDVDRAIELGSEFASWGRERSNAGDERWGLAVVAMAHLLRGDRTAARPLVERAVELEAGVQVLFHPDIDRAVVWLALADGRLDDAEARLRHSVSVSRESGRALLEALSLFDLARIGDAAEVADRLAELADDGDSDLLDLLSEHASAQVDRDPERLGRVLDRFEAAGLRWYAAEAAAHLTRLYSDAGRSRSASAAAIRRDALSDALGGLRTPPMSEVATVVALTRRENEIAQLAARGLTSREIADRLTLSVRTVETHLQRAYTKLGIRGRTELGDALDL